jgi:Uma2 family endonuclease
MKTRPPVRSRKGDPPWEIAELYTAQGYWDEEDYLDLETNRLIEFSEGFIEVLPVPTMSHQVILAFLFNALRAFVEPRELGLVLFAGIRVRLWKRKYRQPDIVFMLRRHADRMMERYWEGVDLAMEVVSGSDEDRRRDLIKKRRDYAKAGIPEYWIVDPAKGEITVLRLSRGKYVVAGKYGKGDTASSVLLDGFSVSVDEVVRQKFANGSGK